MGSEWRKGPIDPTTIPEGAKLAGRLNGEIFQARVSGESAGWQYRCFDPESGDWLDWVEPKWAQNARKILEPLLGPGTFSDRSLQFGQLEVREDSFAYGGAIFSLQGVSYLDLAAFICKIQEDAVSCSVPEVSPQVKDTGELQCAADIYRLAFGEEPKVSDSRSARNTVSWQGFVRSVGYIHLHGLPYVSIYSSNYPANEGQVTVIHTDPCIALRMWEAQRSLV